VPRQHPHTHVAHGQLVGFSLKLFGHSPTYCVFFRTPDGRRVRRDTNLTRIAPATEAARLIIEKEYAPAGTISERVSWDDAVERMRGTFAASGNRGGTLGYYEKCVRLVRAAYPETHGPADITPGLADGWKKRVATTPGRRKKLPSAHYVNGLLGGLSALWQKWFVDALGVCAGNPWQDVEPLKADKLQVEYATDEQIESLYAWLVTRFGDWVFPKLFLSAKAFTGCRLMDLCSLKSAQLRNGRLTFPAGLTKGRKARVVPLPDDLFAALDAFKGETWLWENYLPGLKEALKAKGWPAHRLIDTFDPKRLYHWVETLFTDFRKANPDAPKLTSHMFRKRAFTLAWEMGIDVRHASIAYGCNVDTLMRHYVVMDEQQVTDEVFSKMHDATREDK
jgi:integrase